MKVKLFTHTDLDGVGCAILGHYAFKDIEVEYCNYDDVNEKINHFICNYMIDDYDKVFITDISINEELADYIDNHFNNFVLLDHHSTAKWLNKYKWATVDDYEISPFINEDKMKSSGTSMFYTYLWEKDFDVTRLADFVEQVRRYDTWEWKTKFNGEHPKQINDLCYLIGREQFINRFKNNHSVNFTNEEKLLLNTEQRRIEKYINEKEKQLIIKRLGDYVAGIVFAEQYHSELGNELAIRNLENLDFIVIINAGDGKISYRGIYDNIHLGEFAKLYGGGGHPKAAGSQFDIDLTREFIEKIFE